MFEGAVRLVLGNSVQKKNINYIKIIQYILEYQQTILIVNIMFTCDVFTAGVFYESN